MERQKIGAEKGLGLPRSVHVLPPWGELNASSHRLLVSIIGYGQVKIGRTPRLLIPIFSFHQPLGQENGWALASRTLKLGRILNITKQRAVKTNTADIDLDTVLALNRVFCFGNGCF